MRKKYDNKHPETPSETQMYKMWKGHFTVHFVYLTTKGGKNVQKEVLSGRGGAPKR